ncbi:MAG: IgGFc-binding protein, partial [Flavicella sp.]
MRINYKHIYLCMLVFVLLQSVKLQAQFSKTHYIPPLTSHESSNGLPLDQYLYISTPSTTPVSFEIQEIGGATYEYTVSNSSPYRYYVGYGINTPLFVGNETTNNTYNNKGYIIEAKDLVSVTVKMNGGDGAQAGAMVSKGLAGLGKEFRAGAFDNLRQPPSSLSFISIIATENNTTVTLNNLGDNIQYINDYNNSGNAPISINLNNRESYVLAVKISNNTPQNRDALIGTLIKSDKNIVVTCGSANGSNTTEGNGRDYGFDQIVPIERIGNEYVFTRAYGTNDMENAIIVAHENFTSIYVNGSTSPIANINRGDYFVVEGNNYSNSSAGANMYIRTSKDVYAYQSVGGQVNSANQGLFFVPPINCETPEKVDNIPFIDKVGDKVFTGGMSILTEKNANIQINGVPINNLGGNIDVIGPNSVQGNEDFETYLIEGLDENVSVISDSQVYVAAFGTNNNAAFGGYYSGFPYRPEIFLETPITISNICIPNLTLRTTSITPFENYQWYKDGVAILGENEPFYVPTEPGNYYVEGSISCSASSIRSDEIPVSNCAPDIDDDGIPDAIDIDNDNDGISNCTEGGSPLEFPLKDSNFGSFPEISNDFTGIMTTENDIYAPSFLGEDDGRFVMSVPSGVKNSVSYKTYFNKPLSVRLSYPSSSFIDDALLSNDEKFSIKVPIDKTATIYNPDNQLLIDTNYDGIYESGVVFFSSFDIRFVLNSPALNFGTGTFSINANDVSTFEIKYQNNSDEKNNRVTLQLKTSCVGIDFDGDSIINEFDIDSDNDGILDLTENIGSKNYTINTTDTNQDGMYDIFNPVAPPRDNDNDASPNYQDLDSDNDGIYDVIESGSDGLDGNFDGVLDGLPFDFGTNGLLDNLETSVDSGTINYNLADSDGDGKYNAVELDSDADGCNDVTEAGFTDSNGNDLLGGFILQTDNNGIVTSGSNGYTTPNENYTISAPIEIITQDTNVEVCETKDFSLTIQANSSEIQWQWLMSRDGFYWYDTSTIEGYIDTDTNTLKFKRATETMDGLMYIAIMTRPGNSCPEYSQTITLKVNKSIAIDVEPVTICLGESIDLNELTSALPDSPLSYYLTPEDAENNINDLSTTIVSPTVNTHYFVKATSSENCSTIEKVSITVNDSPTITTTDTSICEGDSIDLQSLVTYNSLVPYTGAMSLVFYNNLTEAQDEINPIANTTVAPSIETDYFVRATNSDNCTSTVESIKITVNMSPIITTTDASICNGDGIDLQSLVTFTGTTGLLFYSNLVDAQNENNPITNTTVAPSIDTDYFVGGTSSDKCASTVETIKITVNNNPIITTTDTSICEGDSIDLQSLVTYTGVMSMMFYNNLTDAQNENNPITNTTVAPSIDTDYFVRGTNSDNCVSAVESIKITVDNSPIITTTDTSICEGDSMDLQSLVTFTSTTSLVFYNNLTDAQNENNPIANTTVAPSNDTDYFVRGTSSDNCVSTVVTIKITVNNNPIITTTDTSICEGDSIDLQSLVTYTGTMSLMFYNNLTDAQNENNSIVNTTVAPSNDTDYFVRGTSPEKCSSTVKKISITTYLNPTIGISETSICEGDSIELQSLVTSVDTTSLAFYYNLSDAQSETNPITNTNISPIKTKNYFVKGTSAENCKTIVGIIKITVNNSPTVSTKDASICEGDSINLQSLVTTVGATSLVFYNNLSDAHSESNPILNNNISPSATEDYFVKATSSENCSSTVEKITITIKPNPIIITSDTSICKGDSIDLQSLIT